jgi:hypothetical protein
VTSIVGWRVRQVTQANLQQQQQQEQQHCQ